MAKKWRSTGLSNEWVKFDMGSAVNVDSFILAAHNFTGAATVKIQANATDAWGAPSIDQTVTVADLMYYIWGSTQTYRWWRILITDAGNTDGYVEFGLSFIGEYYQTTHNIQADFSIDEIDDSVVSFSISGQVYGDKQVLYRIWNFNYPYLTDAEKLALEAMFDTVRTHTPLFFTYDPGAVTLEIFYGVINDDLSFNHIFNYQWNLAIPLREVF